MRRNQNGSVTQSNPYLQAGLAAGYLCRRTQEELHAIGTASGGAVSGTELGEWLGKFFLSQSQAHGAGLDRGQRLSEMRDRAAEGYALPAGSAEIHVRARHQRTLSKSARKRIAAAQRTRWAQYHAAQNEAAVPRKLGRPKNGEKQLQEERRKRWRLAKQKERKPGQTSNPSKAMSKFWSAMTPKQRSEEMIRRFKVRDEKRKAAAATAAA